MSEVSGFAAYGAKGGRISKPGTDRKVSRRMTPEVIDQFFAFLLEGSSVNNAAKRLDYTDAAFWNRRKTHPEFAARWEEVMEQCRQKREVRVAKSGDKVANLLEKGLEQMESSEGAVDASRLNTFANVYKTIKGVPDVAVASQVNITMSHEDALKEVESIIEGGSGGKTQG